MTREEKRELKRWLTGLLPKELSRNDIADEFGVTRKTVSGMLNPDSMSFGSGLTMLRYLRLVGAVVEVPTESPASSRLAALGVKVEQLPTKEDLTRGLDTLREAIGSRAIPGTQPSSEATGQDGR